MRCHLHGCGDFVISISTLSELLPRFNGEPLAINILVSSVAQTTAMLVFLSLKSLIRRRTTLLLVWVSNASEMELIQPTLLLCSLLMVKNHGTSLQMISLTTSQQQDLPYMPWPQSSALIQNMYSKLVFLIWLSMQKMDLKQIT